MRPLRAAPMIAWAPWNEARARLSRTVFCEPLSASRATCAAPSPHRSVLRPLRRPHELGQAIEGLREPDFAGALIAAPHKERAAALVNSLSADARTTGAVN